MILISHRGNISGRKEEEENNPEYILNAIDSGFDVEIDLWAKDKLYLGHDEPQYECPIKFLTQNFRKLWIHCKNLEALEILVNFKTLNFFWHQNDDFTLTSKKFIWTYPGKFVCNRSVLVIDDARTYSGPICFGLCSDFLI